MIIDRDNLDQKDQYIKERVELLMSKGQKYYPWSYNNVREALENRNDEVFLISSIMSGAEVDSDSYIGSAVKKSIFKYWEECATIQADKDYDLGG